MKLLEKILVPVDVNTDSKEQMTAVIKIASEYKSEIILLYVIPDEDLNDEIKNIVVKAVTGSLQELKKMLTYKKNTVREPVIVFGKPVDNIVQIANSENVNLVIIGSSEKKKGAKFKLGIIAEQLVRLSDIPVWVVKTKEETILTNILCPVDFSEPSKRALYNAILFSRKFQSTLRILSVYEPLINVSQRINVDLKEENALRLKKVKSKMDEFIKEFDLIGVNYKIDIKVGIVHEKILGTIKKYGHDLLVMGTNGRLGLSRFFMGSVTEKVIREMPCSFITTKTQDIIQLKLDKEIKEIEIHFKNGNELVKNGFYEEAINEFMICLQINDMHIPSMYKLAEIHNILGDKVKSDYFDNMAKNVLARIWDRKIEMEIRKYYRFEK